MVFLARTRSGLREALDLAAAAGGAVWCSAAAISENDFRSHQGVPLTRFSDSISFAHVEDIARTIATIDEHHPGVRIWLEQHETRAGSNE
ncbi:MULTISPECIES: hypothetical protein [unclassified Pseudoxanthomonas]|uniref:hypothetical protein n=1 Tax=unclassified Pseudoxanthomonas TaxID=2645906 RepID=UPI001618E98C|nr:MULTISPECIES: hypothetical protein [unclassified Pseudoxanthomonas]MBB3274711.1 hypothetical protein [Pseudoxanthomonas sp. OG2]MBV7475458.1 hypothetical protein [Pseudoxanthomonas sp. PXM05]